MWYVKKFFKFIGILILVILIIAALAVGGAFGYHLYMKDKNKAFLTEKGYYSPVSTGERSLNLIKEGAENGKHRIVVLSGAGPAMYFNMKKMRENLAEDYQLIFLSRAGYDMSDDTEADMTVENIVEDYRKALEAAEVEKPYVLMPHSLAGVYASYWVSKYPDEVEAMIDIDGTCPEPKPDAKKTETKFKSLPYYLANAGIGDVRPVLHFFMKKDSALTDEEQRASDIMTVSTFSAKAFEEEGNRWDVNLNTAWEALTPNDVPKIYIAANFGLRTVDEVKELMKDMHPDAELTEEDYQRALDDIVKERSEKVEPLVNKLGSCEIVYLPGDHFIFRQKPDECAKVVDDFLTKIDREAEQAALEAQRAEQERIQKEEAEKKAAEKKAKKKKSKKKKKSS